MNTLPISWSHGRGSLHSLGAMTGPIEFLMADGRRVSPMHISPWINEIIAEDVPPILQNLQGEWPCVPFGAADIDKVTSRWGCKGASSESIPHGYASNAHWQLRSVNKDTIKATIQYPEYSSIRALERVVSAIDGKSALQFNLTINPRTDTRMPVGLHPVFRLPEKVQDVELLPDNVDKIWTYPGDTGGNALFAKDVQCNSLTAIPTPSGEILDASRLPFAGNSESLLLLTGVQGSFRLKYHSEQYQVILRWNHNDFPSLLLWISNRGRQEAPWSGRHLALGVEPVCAAFDLGTDISRSNNPLCQSGVKTVLELQADSLWTTQYSITVEPA